MENHDPTFEFPKKKEPQPKKPHYYGDMIRKIFLICGFIMLSTLPFLKENISAPIFYSLLLILILAFFAGMTNPKLRYIVVGDIFVSLVGFSIFAFSAISRFDNFNLFIVTNLALAALFLYAFYLSIKTFRGMRFSDTSNTPYVAPEVKEKLKDIPRPDHHELTEEERRRKRFMSDESL